MARSSLGAVMRITLVSTSNLPGGLYETMEKEKDSLYNKQFMAYPIGLKAGKFSEELIEIAKLSPSFEREYNLKYGYGLGNIFQGLDDIIMEYDLTLKEGRKGCYGDPAFGSSNFGASGGEMLDGILYVKEAREYPRPSPSAMLDVMEQLAHRFDDNCKIDAAHPGFIRDLNDRGIPAIPVNFGTMLTNTEDATRQSLRSKMTINAAQMVATKKVRIHPNFEDLIAQARAAYFDDKGGLDKKEMTLDILDTFIMMCWDLKEYDYTSTTITADGKIVDYKKKKKKGGLTIETDHFE